MAKLRRFFLAAAAAKASADGSVDPAAVGAGAPVVPDAVVDAVAIEDAAPGAVEEVITKAEETVVQTEETVKAEEDLVESEEQKEPIAAVPESTDAAVEEIAAEETKEAVEDVDKKEVDGFSVEARAQLEESAEQHSFQAETNRLMDIIINSLYTDKLVFLRELVSNASDALEKVRLHSVQNSDYLGDNKDLDIKIEFDEEAKTLSITDSGVGMTKADLINNLGTVAKSGTSNFLEAMADGGNSNLIGQFGVGFYSAFLVADKVTVTSKNNDDAQHVWESSADASFSVSEDPRGDTLGRGSRITLHLKEDARELLSEAKLKELVGKFSQFATYPVYVKTKKEVEEEADDDDDDLEDDDEEEKEDEEEKKEPKAPTKKTVFEWEQVNTQKAIWLRNKEDIKEEEYGAFYKSVSKDYQDPLAHVHFSAEGEVEFKSLLFVPSKMPFGFTDEFWNKKAEVKLYVRRVLVAEGMEDILPRYLSFVRGVVDADDLPLNVSRENLQQSKVIKVISKKLVRKTLELLRKLAQEEDDAAKEKKEDAEEKDAEEKDGDKKPEVRKYSEFYKEFGKFVKLGCHEDDTNRSKLAKLLRFPTTAADSTSLEQYVERAKDGQDSIYYMSGESLDVMRKSPALEVFKQKGLEVLLLEDQLDEGCVSRIGDFEGKKLVSIQKGDLKLPETEEEKTHFKRVVKHFEPLTKWMKKTLTELTETGDLKQAAVKVDKVELSKRLVDAPCVVVGSSYGHSAAQEKMMKAQAFGNKEQMQWMVGGKTLELNPKHPVVQDLLAKVQANAEDLQAKSTVAVLFQAALLEGGFEIADPTALVRRVQSMVAKELGVPADAPLVDVQLPEEEKVEEPAEDAEDEEADDVEEVATDATPEVVKEEKPEEVAEPVVEEVNDAVEATPEAAEEAKIDAPEQTAGETCTGDCAATNASVTADSEAAEAQSVEAAKEPTHAEL